ncbi:MAG: transcriptional regulator MntR [Clostridiaceae bacterium]|nr:transcriptional regulator MntR [Clostridiaceae bacterium]
MDNNEFYTFYEYMRKGENSLTASMEDYLEMIYRLSINIGFTRVHDLSHALNVQPPSVTKMIQKLAELKLLKYEKYGVIMLEDEGKQIAKRLINRHNTIEKFLKLLGTPEGKILEETEKVEHAISSETVKCFQNYINFMKDNPDIYVKFKNYIE